ncbi:MAG: peptidylprolyl isomerase [Clostridiales bacterium]|nr:peptidylprolyl isomerase [Clostridiales bacterium]
MVRIEMEDGGVITLQLYPDVAPITVANFEKLVKEGFYDGLIFHRVINGFMIQGGDPTGTGMGGSPETIKGEFKTNGVTNNLSHTRGTISMARTQVKDSASSQFFICHEDATFLDGEYAAFGCVVDGIEVVDKIAGVDTDMRDKPVKDVRMKKVTLVEDK